jgi:hypothetical protein
MIPKHGANIRLQSLLRSVIPIKASFAAVSPSLPRLDCLDSFGGQNSRRSFFNEPRPH